MERASIRVCDVLNYFQKIGRLLAETELALVTGQSETGMEIRRTGNLRVKIEAVHGYSSARSDELSPTLYFPKREANTEA